MKKSVLAIAVSCSLMAGVAMANPFTFIADPGVLPIGAINFYPSFSVTPNSGCTSPSIGECPYLSMSAINAAKITLEMGGSVQLTQKYTVGGVGNMPTALVYTTKNANIVAGLQIRDGNNKMIANLGCTLGNDFAFNTESVVIITVDKDGSGNYSCKADTSEA